MNLENDITLLRKQKVEELKNQGINPYPNDFRPTSYALDIIKNYTDTEGEDLTKLDTEFLIAGRVMTVRDFGKSAFFHVKDSTDKIQCFIQKNTVGEDEIRFFKRFVDIGDIVGIRGKLFKTKTGELTLNVIQIRLLTKSIKTLPEKWHGLKDVEIRYRQRYLDLICNEAVKEVFAKRTQILKYIRKFMDDNNFIEVETPILHPIAGGAAAKPFKTYHNALDMELYLRIAPELYLKRLIVGGFDKIFEIGRTFRNEGISTQHNPEFTIMEFYQSYADYEDLMDLIEKLITNVTSNLLSSLKVQYQNLELDFSTPWKRINIMDCIRDVLTDDEFRNDILLFKKADSFGINHNNIKGKAILEIFEHTMGSELINPTFVYGFPLDISPLARRNDKDPELTDRFELYIAGREIANAFSELNDPLDQKNRFISQLELKSRGEDEYHVMDDDYITCLEQGMPPTAGAGIGVDRLVMILTNSSSIRDVLLFPHLRPE